MKRNVIMIALGCMLVTGAAQAAESVTSSRWIDGILGGLACRLVSHAYYKNMPSATEGKSVVGGAVVALILGAATEPQGSSWQNFFKYVGGVAVAYAGSLSFFPPAEKRESANDKLAAGNQPRSRN